ncbi:hypothetical protein AC579_7355 [Pseudocercospora musae]|uniref:Uncharacterized protein n=1 Tax=Pseudocercospora musae TaxID=113226 RepID=A0A139ICY9_9PEZI|nr:hypothetical protein AC579_7355 [Pseudocercospora musae]
MLHFLDHQPSASSLNNPSRWPSAFLFASCPWWFTASINLQLLYFLRTCEAVLLLEYQVSQVIQTASLTGLLLTRTRRAQSSQRDLFALQRRTIIHIHYVPIRGHPLSLRPRRQTPYQALPLRSQRSKSPVFRSLVYQARMDQRQSDLSTMLATSYDAPCPAGSAEAVSATSAPTWKV